MITTIVNAACQLPQHYANLKSAYNNYSKDQKKLEKIYDNLEPGCFMFMAGCLAIAPEGAKARVTPFTTLEIDRTNDIRNIRNGDPENYIFASRNLINSWNRILIISLTIFPPVETEEAKLYKQMNSLNVQINNLKQLKENPKPGSDKIGSKSNPENVPVNEDPQKDKMKSQSNPENVPVNEDPQKDKMKPEGQDKVNGSNTEKSLKPNENNPKDPENSSTNTSNENLTQGQSANADSNTAVKEDKKAEESVKSSRVKLCQYMIQGFHKEIRGYGSDASGKPTVTLLQNYISIIEAALRGEKLPPVPDRPVAKSVIKQVKAYHPDSNFDYVVKMIEDGEKAAATGGFDCEKSKTICEDLEAFTKKIGKDFDAFMDQRALI